MQFVMWLENVKKEDTTLVGGKGANLGEMVRMGLPVPAGFIISTKAFDKLLETNELGNQIQKILEQTDVDDTKNLMESSEKIKKLILEQEMPVQIKSEIVEAYRSLSYGERILSQALISLISAGREMAIVAVRSSATTEDLPNASFAGQQASFLNVKGTKELLDAVKKCWASLYEPRAIFYRKKRGFGRASIAVIVQRMVNADKSGVMFTVNPTTGEKNVVIEATWGLGESLVSGAVEPDVYEISRDGKIINKKIGNKTRMRIRDFASDRTVEVNVPRGKVAAQVLEEGEISRLVRFGLMLEEHYGVPQDVEFAIENNRIQILQTRAITTEAKISEVKIEEQPILKGLGASPGIATGKVKIVYTIQDIAKVERGDILVTTMTSPDLVPTMSKAAAIVTDLGGMTSHAAIVSREMGIPAVVGTQNATKILQDNQVITVDAFHGLIYPRAVAVEKAVEKISEEEIEKFSKMKTKIAVKVNVAFAENLEAVAKIADGVGLLRIEHMIAKYGVHPAKLVKEGKAEEYVKILLEGIRPIAKIFAGKPVWVRTLDARSDEFRNLRGGEEELKEDNPMLGWHGIRRSLDEPEILKAEFRAVKLLHEEGLTNVHIMLPFVISVEELLRVREIAKEVGLPGDVKIGIMIETPAAALNIEHFCKAGVDFVSFGSNDLTMLTLGVDRNNPRIAKLYNENDPALRKLFVKVLETCRIYEVETSICGEAASNNEELVQFLIEQGIDSISVNIDALPRMKAFVSKIEKSRISA
jgi:pyruvate,water dikinase